MKNYLNNRVSVVEKIWASVFIVALVFQGIVLPPQAKAVDVETLLFEDAFDQSGSGIENDWDSFSGASGVGSGGTNARVTVSDDGFVSGADLSKGLIFEGSGNNSDDPDEGAERVLSTKGYATLFISYYREVAGLDSNDSFVASYSLGDSGSFTGLETLTATTTDSTSFEISNPERHTKITVRFYMNGDHDETEAVIDNFELGGNDSPLFYEGFESNSFGTNGWVETESPLINNSNNNAYTDNNDDTNAHSANLDGDNSDPGDAIEVSIDTTGFEDLYVRYARKVDDMGSGENLSSYYSVDGGANWIQLEGVENIKPDSKTTSFGLLEGADNNDEFMLKFEVTANNANDEAYLDDVVVWGTAIAPADDSDPLVEITSPDDGDEITLGNTVDIYGTVIDDNPNTYTLTITDGDFTQVTGPITEEESFGTPALIDTWDTTGREPGDYTITLSATDDFGNTSEHEIIVTIPTPISYGSIQGIKYADDDGDGERDDGEAPLNDWTISLYDDEWSFVSSMLTGEGSEADGVYVFSGQEYGSYYVCEETRDDWTATGPDGIYLESEFEGDPQNCIAVTLDGSTGAIDLGNFEYASVSGTKWNDENQDGLFGETESGISGWEISIGDGNSTTTIETDEVGNYEFTELLAGDYSVCEEESGTWAQTYPDTDDGCYAITINQSGQNIADTNFGNFALPPTSISGYKWTDLNENEDRDENEGISGWTIELNWGDGESMSTTTNANGYYKFPGLDIGEYEVCEEDRAGWMRIDNDWLCDELEINELGVDYSDVNFENALDEDEDILDAPTLVSPINNAYVQGDSIDLVWDDVLNAVNYGLNVFSDENLATLWDSDQLSATTTAYSDVDEGAYWWRVKAYDEGSETSAWSDVFKFTVDDTVPESLFTSPNEGTEWLDFVDVAGESNDNNNVDFVTLSFATYTPAEGEGEQQIPASCGEFSEITQIENADTGILPFVWDYNWTPGGVGDYCIKASATDLARNAEASPIVMNIQYNGTTPAEEDDDGGGGGGSGGGPAGNGPVGGLNSFGVNAGGATGGTGGTTGGGSVAFVPPTTGGGETGGTGSTGGTEAGTTLTTGTGATGGEGLVEETTLPNELGDLAGLENTNENQAAAASLAGAFFSEVGTSWWFWLALLLLAGYLTWYYYFKKKDSQ